MDLILWRHAQAVDADDHIDDLKRPLTREGEEQAKEMAVWLRRHLPADTRVLVSPALRTRQTALRLTKNGYTICQELAPNGQVDDLLRVVGWPDAGTAALWSGISLPSVLPPSGCWACRCPARSRRDPYGGCSRASVRESRRSFCVRCRVRACCDASPGMLHPGRAADTCLPLIRAFFLRQQGRHGPAVFISPPP